MKISEYFTTLKGYAVEGAKITAQKTKQAATIAKANVEIRAEEDKIKKAYAEMGKLFYKDYIVGEEPDMAEYLPWCEKVTASKETIEDLKLTIEDMKANGEKEDEFVVEVVESDCCCGGDCHCHDHDHETEEEPELIPGDRPVLRDRDCGCGDDKGVYVNHDKEGSVIIEEYEEEL